MKTVKNNDNGSQKSVMSDIVTGNSPCGEAIITEREEIKDTPFDIIGNEENGYKIAMGNNIVSPDTFESKFDAIKYVDSKPYNLIIVAAAIFYENIQKIKNTKNE